MELFIWFAALNRLNPDEPTVGIGVGKLITTPKKGVPPALDSAKVQNLTNDIRQKAEQLAGEQSAKQLRDQIKDRVEKLPIPTYAISGKDFLFPLFEYHLSECGKTKLRRTSFRLRLARHCSTHKLVGLSDAMKDSVFR